MEMIERTRRYLSHALRSLCRSPAFTTTTILTLGLGIGVATAMFTVFRAVLLTPLPVENQGRILELTGVAKGAAREVPLNLEQFRRFRLQTHAFSAVAGFAHWGAVDAPIMDGDHQLIVRQSFVTANFFQVLGAVPALGRLFEPSDDQNYVPSGTDPNALVAVISYDLWRRQFGGDSGVIGRRVRMPELKWNPVIVGVAPPGLEYPRGVQFWTPNNYDGLDLVARLAPAATPAGAREEYLRFVRADPDYQKYGMANTVDARVESFQDMVVGDIQPALMALTVGVGLLLLLACFNVGSLALLRATGRAREIATRRALGAGPGDVAKQLAAESALLGIGGGAVGLVAAVTLMRLFLWLAPEQLPRLDVLRIAPAPLFVATAVTLATVLLFGLLPALAMARTDPFAQLRGGAGTGREGRRLRVVRRTLVAAQVGLALVLLSGGGLLMRTFVNLARLDMGYNTGHLSYLEITMPWQKWVVQCGGSPHQADSAAMRRYAKCGKSHVLTFHEQVLQQLRLVPGVEKASPVGVGPFLGPSVLMAKLVAEGQSDADATRNPWVGYEVVSHEFFDVLGLPILRGRGFTDADREGSPNVAVVTLGVAAQLWPGQDPVGKSVRALGTDQPLLTVVGLVADIHYREHRQATPMIIRPYRQDFAQGHLLIRTRGLLGPLVPAIRSAVRTVDGSADLTRARTMDDVLAPQIAQPRLNAFLISACALAALVLAAVGLYGVMASAVSQQTRELGIRSALGATPGRVRAMVLGQAFAIAGTGAGVGLLVALAGSRLLTSLLFGVSPADPLTLGSVSVVLLLISLLAAYQPARQATKIDLVRVLRAD